tara:strand:+ start:122 stop:547 length:426 start_codon:yes stop_codon:yes gene_type:complete
MATTTAAITISSSDMMDNAINISNSTTLTTAGTSTGMTETTGLGRVKLATTTATDIITYANIVGITSADLAHKVYVKNTGSSTTQSVKILIGNTGGTPVAIGNLYGGDWMFFPWSAGSNEDIVADPSTTDEVVLEYMVFFE